MRFLAQSSYQTFIVLFKIARDLEQTLALFFPEVDAHLVVALDHLQLLPKRFKFGHGLHFVVRLLLVPITCLIQLLLVNFSDCGDKVSIVVLTALQLSNPLFLRLEQAKNLAEVDRREHLKLSSLRLELVESFGLGVLELQEFLLLYSFTFNVIL